MYTIAFIVAVIVIIFLTVTALLSRYKKCPSNKVLVIYGRVGKKSDGSNSSAKCVHGGAAFVYPVIQDYGFLDLSTFSITADLKDGLSKQNIRVSVPSVFTVAISTEPTIMQNAAERLFGSTEDQIKNTALDIIMGQLRQVIAMMDIEQINSDRATFQSNIMTNVETELNKIGLQLLNVNIKDIKDESGYLDALGKEAAAKVINEALQRVAEQTREGQIGKAKAEKDQAIGVAEAQQAREIGVAEANRTKEIGIADADSTSRIKVSEANAKAIQGENLAEVTIAQSDAEKRAKKAEAQRISETAERIAVANIERDSYDAQKQAELARASMEEAKLKADVLVKAEVDKRNVEITADADAERIKRLAKGEADATRLRLEAQAAGEYAILSKRAEGFQKMIEAAGNNPDAAVKLMLTEKLPEIVRTQVDAIRNIKFDNVVVWDSGNGNGNSSSTSNWAKNLLQAVPPLDSVYKMAGLEMPSAIKPEAITPEATEMIRS